MIHPHQLYRLNRALEPSPNDIRCWREGLGLSVTAAGQTLNLGNPSVTMRAYEREGSGRAPAPPTVALMDTLVTITQALLAMRAGEIHRAEALLAEALPTPLRDQIYECRGVPIV